jgi:hypothetical protein
MSGSRDDVHHESPASRALVPLAREEGARAGCVRPLATFIAQMLACRERLPDFRAHRRAPPTDAAARYGAAPAPSQPSRIERIL